MTDKNFSHAAAVFPVEEVKTSAEYYRDKLGFEITFEWGDPVTYAVLKRGEGVSVHLVRKEDELFSPSMKHTALYVFVRDVDAIYAEYQANGVNITNLIGDRDYGMRDFDITDPNGFVLSFSMSLDR